MICNNCGTVNAEGSVFCANCGAPLQAANTQAYADPAVNAPGVGASPEINPTVEAVDPGKNFGLASLILGIVSLAISLFCSCACSCLGPVALIVGAIGLVLAVMAVKKSKIVGIENKQAKIGFILSAIGVVLSILGFIIALILSLSGVTGDIMNDLFY